MLSTAARGLHRRPREHRRRGTGAGTPSRISMLNEAKIDNESERHGVPVAGAGSGQMKILRRIEVNCIAPSSSCRLVWLLIVFFSGLEDLAARASRPQRNQVGPNSARCASTN